MASGTKVPGGANALFTAIAGVACVAGMAVFCVPIAIMIHFLRSKRVREAVRGVAA
jgi:hypothetical protein